MSTTGDYQPMMQDPTAVSGYRLDRAFLQDMIGHHMVAVMLSQYLFSRGTDHQGVAGLAESIRDDQHRRSSRCSAGSRNGSTRTGTAR